MSLLEVGPSLASLPELVGVDDVAAQIQARLDEREALHESLYTACRALSRLARRTIQGMQRQGVAGACVEALQLSVLGLRETLQAAPDQLYVGFVTDALQESAEAFFLHAFLTGSRLPTPDEAAVTDIAYLLGLADTIGELRRLALKCLRNEDVPGALRFLQAMERLEDALMRFAYGRPILHLKPKQDVARLVIERTRAEISIAAKSAETLAQLDECLERL